MLSSADAAAEELDSADLEAMHIAASAYAEASLTNDADTVMAKFVDEPVLSPPGLPYLERQKAAQTFWFPPDSPPTTVTDFDMLQTEVSESGDLGYYRGALRLVFEYDGRRYEKHGKCVTILRKGADGGWCVMHHIRDDLPRTD